MKVVRTTGLNDDEATAAAGQRYRKSHASLTTAADRVQVSGAPLPSKTTIMIT